MKKKRSCKEILKPILEKDGGMIFAQLNDLVEKGNISTTIEKKIHRKVKKLINHVAGLRPSPTGA